MTKWKKIIFLIISLSFLLVGYNQCVIEAPKNATAKKINSATNQSVSSPSNNTASNTSPIPTPVPTTGSTMTGSMLFDQQVRPVFESNCMSCHAPPVNNPIIAAPLTIYNYDLMVIKLKAGSTGTSNQLMDKVTAILHKKTKNNLWIGLVCDFISCWFYFSKFSFD